MSSRWEFVAAGPEGERLDIVGVNVWSHRWIQDESAGCAKVKDPLYQQDFSFRVYHLDLPTRHVRFAAGEFSNGIWGFYVER